MGLSPLSCTPGQPATLATDASLVCSAAYTVTAADAAAEVIDNTATADSDQTGPDTDTETVQVPTPELNITKDYELIDADGSGDVSVGDTITYTYSMTNTGTANFTDVTLSDSELPGVSVTTLTSGLTDIDSDGTADDLAAVFKAVNDECHVARPPSDIELDDVSHEARRERFQWVARAIVIKLRDREVARVPLHHVARRTTFAVDQQVCLARVETVTAAARARESWDWRSCRRGG